MTGHLTGGPAGRAMRFEVRNERRDHLAAGRRLAGLLEDLAVRGGEEVGVLVGGPADHHAVDLAQLLLDLVETGEAAVDLDHQLGMLPLEAVHVAVP